MNATELDILRIDQEILNNFAKEKEMLPEIKGRLKSIKSTIFSASEEGLKTRIISNLKKTEEDLEQQIYEIENDIQLNFYKVETAEILDKYKESLNTLLKPSFIKPPTQNKEKRALVNEFLKVASNYIEISLEPKKETLVCKNCKNRKDFDLLDSNIYICSLCSVKQVVLKNISSYKDIDRVNGSTRYTYVRRVHFRDAINQYQAKQNSTISDEVYDKLVKELINHGLVNEMEPEKQSKFQAVSKDHIRTFLQELGYPKHYENINLIHFTITGIKPDDISYLEEKLMKDFDILTDLYDKKYKTLDRKSFINTQFVLYQLLLRHKHSCKQDDFAILKTIDRKNFHNDVMSDLFSELSWNYTYI